MTHLPIIDGGETCFTCPAPCCTSYVVPITGFDLWRMVRGLQLPWREVAEVRVDRIVWEGFSIDGETDGFGFFLRTRPGSEICQFLLLLPSGPARCGAHTSRPLACRVYPWRESDNSQLGIEMISHAQCPRPQRAYFEENMLHARSYVTEELGERPLYRFLVSRWNDFAGKKTVEGFVAWVLALYDALQPLRLEDEWRQKAQRLISEFPI